MPASSSNAGTSATIQTAYNSVFGQAVIAAGTTFTSDVLWQDGLPQCNAYVLQDTAGTVEATVEFLQTPGVWLPFESALALVVDVPQLKHYALGAPAYRVRIANKGGASVTVYWRLTATVPGA